MKTGMIGSKSWAGKGMRVPKPSSPAWISNNYADYVYHSNKLNGVLWPTPVGLGFYDDMLKSVDWSVVNTISPDNRFIHRQPRATSRSIMIWFLLPARWATRYDPDYYADAEAEWDLDISDCQDQYDEMEQNTIYVHGTLGCGPEAGYTTKHVIPPSRTPPDWINVEFGNWKNDSLYWATDLYDYFNDFVLRRQYMNTEIVNVLSSIENKVHPERIYLIGELTDWFYEKDIYDFYILPPLRTEYFETVMEYELAFNTTRNFIHPTEYTSEDWVKALTQILIVERYIRQHEEPPDPSW